MTNWHQAQSSVEAFDKLYHRLIGSLLEFQLVPPQFLVRLEKVMMILYPDIVRQIAENEGDIGDDGVGALYSATSWFLSGLPNRYREVSIRDRP